MSEDLRRSMLIRLKTYRKAQCMSQEKFAKSLGVGQTYYSQVENGEISLSYHILDGLYSFDCDIDNLVTGTQKLSADGFLTECIDNTHPASKMNIYTMIITGFLQMWDWDLNNHWEKCLYSELVSISVLRMMRATFDERLFYLRIVNGMSQQELANLLGIGRTKCGKCEQGTKKLDAQLMIYLYKHGYCLPSFFFEEYVGLKGIATLLEKDRDKQSRFYEYVRCVMNNITNCQ